VPSTESAQVVLVPYQTKDAERVIAKVSYLPPLSRIVKVHARASGVQYDDLSGAPSSTFAGRLHFTPHRTSASRQAAPCCDGITNISTLHSWDTSELSHSMLQLRSSAWALWAKAGHDACVRYMVS
jgi:hypothetical protein